MASEKTQNRTIETTAFSVRGNLIAWDRMMLQLSNVSAIGIGDFPEQAFPRVSIPLLVVGLIISIFIRETSGKVLGLLLLAAAAFLIYGWYSANQKSAGKKYLHIQMNSGDIYSLLFHNIAFLQQAKDVLERLLSDPEEYIGDNVFNFNVSAGEFKMNDVKFNNWIDMLVEAKGDGVVLNNPSMEKAQVIDQSTTINQQGK